MPSPFPGMDPYLEEPSLWPDFHMTMLVFLRAGLKAILPPRYVPYLDRYVWLEDSSEDQARGGAPDLFVADREAESAGPAVATLAAPGTVVLPAVLRQGTRYMRIVDRQNRRVVTVVELLSHSNKAVGEDREAYLRKRNDCIGSRTNLVEIDLLRAGKRLPPEPAEETGSEYRVLVSRPGDFPEAGVWDFGVRDPLPTITIPLDASDPPVRLELKPCFDRAYDAAPYGTDLDYTLPPVPALRKADIDWARQLLAAHNQGASS